MVHSRGSICIHPLLDCRHHDPGWSEFKHNNGVIISAMASQVTNLTTVYSTVYSGANQRKSKIRVTGLCAENSPVNSPHKWPVTRKMFPFDDVIMDKVQIAVRTEVMCKVLCVPWGRDMKETLQLKTCMQNAATYSVVSVPFDVIMSAMVYQITNLTIVYSTVYSGVHQRKHQSSSSLVFVLGIHRWPVNSPHKGPVTRKMFPFDDVILFHRILQDYFTGTGTMQWLPLCWWCYSVDYSEIGNINPLWTMIY